MYRGIVIAESLTDWVWVHQVRVVDSEIGKTKTKIV